MKYLSEYLLESTDYINEAKVASNDDITKAIIGFKKANLSKGAPKLFSWYRTLEKAAGKNPGVLYDNKTYKLYRGISYFKDAQDHQNKYQPNSGEYDWTLNNDAKELAERDYEKFARGVDISWSTDIKRAESYASIGILGAVIEYSCSPDFIVADLSQKKYADKLGFTRLDDKEVLCIIPKGEEFKRVKIFYKDKFISVQEYIKIVNYVGPNGIIPIARY